MAMKLSGSALKKGSPDVSGLPFVLAAERRVQITLVGVQISGTTLRVSRGSGAGPRKMGLA